MFFHKTNGHFHKYLLTIIVNVRENKLIILVRFYMKRNKDHYICNGTTMFTCCIANMYQAEFQYTGVLITMI